MSKVVLPIHGPDHEPGGPDPVRMQLPYARAANDAGGTQTTDALAIPFNSFFTNSPDLFEESVDGDGIIVTKRGFFFVAGAIGSADTDATIYTQAQPESSYPTFGSEFGWGFAVQPFAFDSSLITATKSRRTHMAFGNISVTAGSPWKVIVASAKRTLGGPNVGYSFAGLVVVRIAPL